MSKISVARYGVRAKQYVRLLLKDDDGLWRNDIPLIFEGEYYSLTFRDKSYLISHHIQPYSLKGVGYYVLSIAIPRGRYLMNWKSIFDELEHIVKDALYNAESATEFKALLLSSATLGQAMTRWSLSEDTKQFRINVIGKDRIRKGLLNYANAGDLELYFRYPCRPAYIGYDTIYFAERDSKVAEKFISMKLSEVHEPVTYECRYSVIAEYYAGGKKLGETIYPEKITSENEVVSFKIDEPNYEKTTINGSLKDNWDTWYVRKNDVGTGFILTIQLKPEEVCIRLVCKELDKEGLVDYGHYIRVSNGVLKENVVVQRGREIGHKVHIIPIEPYEVDIQYGGKGTVEFYLKCLCRVSVSGKYVERALKNNKLSVEYQIQGEKSVILSENSSYFSIVRPKEKAVLCKVRLKGHQEYVTKIEKSNNDIKICLIPKQSILLLYRLSDVVRRGGIPFVLGGVIIGGCVAWYMNKNMSSDSVSFRCADSTDTISIPNPVSVGAASSEETVLSQEDKVADDTFLADATEYIEVLGGIDFTTDDIKDADDFYKKNKNHIDSATATLLRKKIKCAKEIIRACQKGFDYRSVKATVAQEAVNSVYANVQKKVLRRLIERGVRCSQESGKSIREKIERLEM